MNTNQNKSKYSKLQDLDMEQLELLRWLEVELYVHIYIYIESRWLEAPIVQMHTPIDRDYNESQNAPV